MERVANHRTGIWRSGVAAALVSVFAATASAGAPAEASVTRQTSAVHSFETGLAPVAGASATLVRHRNGISFTIETSALKPGHAYTVWWVIFNRPRYCTDPLLAGLAAGSAT